MDGLSSVLMYLNLCDNPDIKDVPSIMVRFSAFQELVQMIVLPLYVLWLNVKLLLLIPSDTSPFTKPEIIKNLTA